MLEDAQGEVQVRDLAEVVPDSLTHLLEVRTKRAAHKGRRARATFAARARQRLSPRRTPAPVARSR